MPTDLSRLTVNELREDIVYPDSRYEVFEEMARRLAALEALMANLPPIPDDLAMLPSWWSDDADAPSVAALHHSKVARFVGEFGLSVLQASNTSDGRGDDWPVGDWDGLANSSRWSCVRAGFRALQAARRPGAAGNGG